MSGLGGCICHSCVADSEGLPGCSIVVVSLRQLTSQEYTAPISHKTRCRHLIFPNTLELNILQKLQQETYLPYKTERMNELRVSYSTSPPNIHVMLCVICVFYYNIANIPFLLQPCRKILNAEFFQTVWFLCMCFSAEYALGSSIAFVHKRQIASVYNVGKKEGSSLSHRTLLM